MTRCLVSFLCGSYISLFRVGALLAAMQEGRQSGLREKPNDCFLGCAVARFQHHTQHQLSHCPASEAIFT